MSHNSGCKKAFSRFKANITKGTTDIIEFNGSIALMGILGTITLESEFKQSTIDDQFGTVKVSDVGNYSFTMTGTVSAADGSVGKGDSITNSGHSASGSVGNPADKKKRTDKVDEYRANGRFRKIVLQPKKAGLTVEHDYETLPCPNPAGQ